MYTSQYAAQAGEMVGFIPCMTFFEFMDKVKSEPYEGKKEWETIRSEMPDWVIKLDRKSGVLGKEDFIPYDGEE